VSEPEPYELFSDPRRMVEDGRIAKLQRRDAVARIFAPPELEPAPEPDVDAIADAVVARIADRLDVEREQPRDSRGRYANATGFDGGAGQSVARPSETHEQTLIRLLRSRAADRGGAF
jgi:hypothetical protein